MHRNIFAAATFTILLHTFVGSSWADDAVKVKESLAKWEQAKATCKGNYRYQVRTASFAGSGSETTIVVKSNKVVERQYRAFQRARGAASARRQGSRRRIVDRVGRPAREAQTRGSSQDAR